MADCIPDAAALATDPERRGRDAPGGGLRGIDGFRRGNTAGTGVALKALQVRVHIRGMLVTQVAVLFECLAEDAFQVTGTSALRRTWGFGERFKIASKMLAVLFPGTQCPVAIS